jgi:ATP-dependent helicase/DNAse subunit B
MATHRLITSVSLLRLEAALFRGIMEQKQGDALRPVVVLCGSSFLGHYLSRELARGGSPHACISFLTCNELAEALAGPSLRAQKALPVPAGGKELIARKLIRNLPPESYFRQVQDQPHLPQVLSATFTDIEDSRINLERAVEALPARRESGLALDARRKLNEVAQLYRQYTGETSVAGAHRLFTEAGLLAEAARQAENFSIRFGTNKLLVYGFYEMTGAQRELLSRLAGNLDLTAYLLAGEGSRTLRKWWQALAGAEDTLTSGAPTNNLATLRAGVFTGNYSEHASDGSVRVLSCPNEVSEAREIAREAIRLKRDWGIPFSEMAVVARDAATYLPLLAGIFEQIGVPFYIREGLPLSSSAPGRSILAALCLPESGYRRGDVMQWLTSGAIDTRSLTTDGTEAPMSLWDRISADAGVVQGEVQWHERLPVQARAYQAQAQAGTENRKAALDHLAQQTENLLAFLRQLFTFGNHCRQQQTWSALAEAACAFLRRVHPPTSERDRVESALSSLRELDRLRQPASLAGFIAAAEQTLAGVSRTRGVFQQTGVHLMSLAAARHTRFRTVFVPGLTEGSFPVAGRQDPILLDEERRALSMGGGAVLPLKSTRPQEERFLFRLALEAATEHIVLTMPRAEAASGAEKIASHYLLQSVECLAGRPIHQAALQSPGAAPAHVVYIRNSSLLADDCHSALDSREFDLRFARALLASEHPADARYLEQGSSNLARAVEAEQAQWGSDGLTVYDGLLATPECRHALGELFSAERVYAPTALERYAACPYRFFLHDVLRLQELEEPELVDEIDARDKGELMHVILRDFYAAMKAEKKLPLAPGRFEDYRAALAAISQEHFRRVESEGQTGPPATWALKQQFILQDLERHVRSELGSDWLPEDFERAFGMKDFPGFELPIGDEAIQLRGQIDRIDLSPDRTAIRVVDYKSGKKRYNLEVSLLGGKALQLPLYLLAAASLYRRIELRQSTAEYCYITRRGEWKTCVFPGAALAEKQEELSTLLRTIIDGCREGVFPHCPDEKSPTGCRNCEFTRIGDPRRQVLWERKQTDPRLAPFLHMREVE